VSEKHLPLQVSDVELAWLAHVDQPRALWVFDNGQKAFHVYCPDCLAHLGDIPIHGIGLVFGGKPGLWDGKCPDKKDSNTKPATDDGNLQFEFMTTLKSCQCTAIDQFLHVRLGS